MTNRSLVVQCPGYYISDDTMGQRYNEELREAFKQDTLQEHVEKWAPLFQLGRDKKPSILLEVEDEIVAGNLDWGKVRECLEPLLKGGTCEHVGKSLLEGDIGEPGEEQKPCPGMCLILPYAVLAATLLSHDFGVPFCTALHQRFCDDPEHEGCF